MTLVSTTPLKRLKWTSTGLTVPGRLQTLVKTMQSVLPFGLIPYSQPPCLIACGPISSISKDPLYTQGSDAGSDYSCAGTSIASSLVILPGFQAETVKLHRGVEGVRQSSSAHRGLWFPCSVICLHSQTNGARRPSRVCCRGPYLRRCQHHALVQQWNRDRGEETPAILFL